MNEPLIFSEEEQHERFQFHLFYTQTFITHQKATKHFVTGLDAEIFFSIFKTLYPDTHLTVDIIEHILLFGGYLDNNEGRVFCDINEQNFKLWPVSVQKRILDYADYKATIPLRQIMDPDKSFVLSPFGNILDIGLRLFLQNYVFWKKGFQFYAYIPKDSNKGKPKDIYALYQRFCLANKYLPVTQKALNTALTKKGGVLSKSYYQGNAGVSVFTNLCIPLNPNTQTASIELGLGIIALGEKLFFNDARAMDDFSEEGLQSYINARKDVQDESQTTEAGSSEQREQTSLSRTEITNTTPDDTSRTEESSTEDRSGTNNGSNQNVANECYSNEPTAEPICDGRNNVTSGHAQKGKLHNKSTSNKTTRNINRDEDISSKCTTDSDKDDTNIEEIEPTGTEKITTQDIIDMLVIACKINPHNTSKQDMATYLDTIRIDYPEISSIDVYWDLLQKTLSEVNHG